MIPLRLKNLWNRLHGHFLLYGGSTKAFGFGCSQPSKRQRNIITENCSSPKPSFTHWQMLFAIQRIATSKCRDQGPCFIRKGKENWHHGCHLQIWYQLFDRLGAGFGIQACCHVKGECQGQLFTLSRVGERLIWLLLGMIQQQLHQRVCSKALGIPRLAFIARERDQSGPSASTLRGLVYSHVWVINLGKVKWKRRTSHLAIWCGFLSLYNQLMGGEWVESLWHILQVVRSKRDTSASLFLGWIFQSNSL